MGAFADRVFAVVKQIPRGKVATYGQIARIIGAPRAARYVGYALRANPSPGTEPESIPCHRVVFKDGRMATGFAFGGPEIQQQMLEEEGVGFDEEGKVVMESFLWNGVPADESGLPMGPPSAPPPRLPEERFKLKKKPRRYSEAYIQTGGMYGTRTRDLWRDRPAL